MRWDFVGGQASHVQHLLPIWHALPETERGTWWAGRHRRQLEALGIDPVEHRRPPREGAPVLVASWADLNRVAPRGAVVVNHGSGQRYEGDAASAGNPSYSGGRERDNVVAYLCPGDADAAVCHAAQSDVPCFVVGIPKLDPWHRTRPSPEPGTVAVSFHWDSSRIPEWRWAWPHYQHVLGQMAADGWQLLGHAHPRIWRHMHKQWTRLGVEPVRDFAEVLDRASVYAVDNSSTGVEFASTRRPAVWLNAPWYRRDVHHGGRFWTWTQDVPVVDEGADLPETLDRAMTDDWWRAGWQRHVSSVYVATDGHATDRAVAALAQIAEQLR